jgi:dihydroceramidase
MGFSLPAFKYPSARPEEGFWAPVTSTINWCEGNVFGIDSQKKGSNHLAEDYYATIYSAEIVNTLTNLLFIALGIKGIRNCIRYKHDNVFLIAFIGCKTA